MSAQKSQKHAQCTQMEAQVIHSERKRKEKERQCNQH